MPERPRSQRLPFVRTPEKAARGTAGLTPGMAARFRDGDTAWLLSVPALRW